MSALVKSQTLRRFSALAAAAVASAKTDIVQAMQVLKEALQPLGAMTGPIHLSIADMSELRQQLKAELRASVLLKHLARLSLTVLAHPLRQDVGKSLGHLTSWFGSVCNVCQIEGFGVLSCLLPVSPCLSYFVSCSLVSACADLERGPGRSLYGMPPAHWLRERMVFVEGRTSASWTPGSAL
ncbi:hypothetical protein GPECTOR_1858g920 [Gonium pectorale]|uniref:Uncharacterized protein n=1 Tax=Gonium pectorale TaxID=33097 RepID=A0A150FTE1_GONPE|nr:hypothetical protein GPECTOR_1858g920 [Gonium pectorale]|eukprot:KXZ40848.1 hypothetical protein GPECTOR_1858g920 [Gonium pectorale]